MFAHAVVAKGSDDDGYAVSRMAEDIAWLGHTKIILKSDNERAIVKVLKDSLRTARVEVEELEQIQEEQSVKYDSKSNGDVENAVKQVTKLLRTLIFVWRNVWERKSLRRTHSRRGWSSTRRGC